MNKRGNGGGYITPRKENLHQEWTSSESIDEA